MPVELITGENDKGRRLDRILRKALPGIPLPLIHRLIRQGRVFLDGKPAKAQNRVDSGVKINIQSLKTNNIESQKMQSTTGELDKSCQNTRSPLFYCTCRPLDIIWQGKGLIAVNKPSGLDVHGPGSLDTMVRSFLAGKLSRSLSFKPGPLHRLDKPSSGIVVFSANIDGARLFSSLMRERKVEKTYLAIVQGNMAKEEVWEDSLLRDKDRKKTYISNNEKEAGKKAVTKVRPLAGATANGKQYSLVTAEIATGRTHQIRAQAAAHGYPLAGDRKYEGLASGGFRGGFFLHAWKMRFLNYKIEAPLPAEFKRKITGMFGPLENLF